MSEKHIYVAARERLAALETEREELLTFLRTYERLAVSAVPTAPTATATAPAMPFVSAPRWSSAAIIEAAMQVLTDNRRPMKLGDLFAAVIARGAQIGGKNPRNNFGAMLSVEKLRIRRTPDGWWFTDEDYPRRLDDAEYDEGPEAEATEPRLTNGAAGGHQLGA